MAGVVVLTDRPGTDPTWSDDLLRQAGYDVIVADDMDRGIATAAEGRAMLIVLRVGGSTIEACNVCRAIRTHPVTRSMPLLVVTRVDDLFTRDQFVRAGATAILMEPPRAALLLRQVRRLTGRHAATTHRAGDASASAATGA